MCIRDRGWRVTAPPRKRSAAPIRGANLALPPAAPALANGCLLYTSDAADERSSVDLGGRRIIKKKKRATMDVASLALTDNSKT